MQTRWVEREVGLRGSASAISTVILPKSASAANPVDSKIPFCTVFSR
jgi:hypothetical protein